MNVEYVECSCKECYEKEFMYEIDDPILLPFLEIANKWWEMSDEAKTIYGCASGEAVAMDLESFIKREHPDIHRIVGKDAGIYDGFTMLKHDNAI